MKLERVSPPSQENGNGNAGEEAYAKSEEEVGEEELRNWADFRELQARFAASGGVLTEF
jgi:hypothetical protein